MGVFGVNSILLKLRHIDRSFRGAAQAASPESIAPFVSFPQLWIPGSRAALAPGMTGESAHDLGGVI